MAQQPDRKKDSRWNVLKAFGTRTRTRRDEDERSRWIAVSLAVITSFLLWFSFTMTETYSVTLQLPTRVQNLPAREALRTLPPQTVRVQLQAEGFQIFRLKYSPPAVLINANLDEVVVRDALTDMPKGVVVQVVSPEVIRLQKAPRISRRVPVQVRADIELPPTHDWLDSLTTIPDSVTVWGAADVVSHLGYWPTERFEEEGLKDSLRAQVELADTLSGLVILDRRTVTLVGEPREFTEGRRDMVIEIRGVPNPDDVVSLRPRTISVRYRVLFSDYFKAQRAPDFYAEVRYDALRSDTTGSVRPIVHVPPDLIIRDIEIDPPAVSYFWRVAE